MLYLDIIIKMFKTKYFYLCSILLFKRSLFWVNDPEQNQFCFQLHETFDSDACYAKGGNIINAKTEMGDELINANFCCNVRCGINGTVIGPHCKWIKDKSICKLNSNLLYVDHISILGSRYTNSKNLLKPIYDTFNFDLSESYGMDFCTFKSKEDLLINFANQINGKFVYSLGGGHKHFDKRLMDTSEGRGLIESTFLIYPTYGISGVSDGVNYDDRNVLGYDCSGLSMALIYLIGGYYFDRENTNAQKMYDIAKEKKLLKKEIKIGYAIFYGKSENSISHVTIALGENKMIEASGHNPDKTGKPIQIVNIRDKMVGIADFISKYESQSQSQSYTLNLPCLFLFVFLLI